MYRQHHEPLKTIVRPSQLSRIPVYRHTTDRKDKTHKHSTASGHVHATHQPNLWQFQLAAHG